MPPAISSAPYRDYYCYALVRDGAPFYVGKGRGKRWREHEQRARRGERSHKANIIRQIIASGAKLECVIFQTGLSGAEAIQLEIDIIRLIGRRPIGPLINRTDGGDGIPGWRHSAATRAKIAKAHMGMQHTEEARAKMRGKFIPMEMRLRISAAKKGVPRNPEATQATALALLGRKRSPDTIEKIRLAALQRPAVNEEVRRKMSDSAKARAPMSAETRTKMSATRTGKAGKPHSEETKALLSAIGRGRKLTAEHRAAIGAGIRGRKQSPEHIAKRVAAKKARLAAKALTDSAATPPTNHASCPPAPKERHRHDGVAVPAP